MTLSGGGQYAIHGTNNEGSIGKFVSHGCILHAQHRHHRSVQSGQRRHARRRNALAPRAAFAAVVSARKSAVEKRRRHVGGAARCDLGVDASAIFIDADARDRHAAFA